MKIKVAELAGTDLDYWVAKCVYPTDRVEIINGECWWDGQLYQPSQDWNECGRLLVLYRLGVGPLYDKNGRLIGGYGSGAPRTKPMTAGLAEVAILRAVVASVKGEEFEA